MLRPTKAISLLLSIVLLFAGSSLGQQPVLEVIFQEDFSDLEMPRWHGLRPATVKLSQTQGPDGAAALTMKATRPVSSMLSVALPAERIAGRTVLLDVWRKAKSVKTGTQPYFNAKSMLTWKSKNSTKTMYSTTTYSDFSGTFDWERHRYVVVMPKDLERANLTIGLQECTGTASWARLTVSVDPRFLTQQGLEQFLIREQQRAFANIKVGDITVRYLDGGTVQVFAAHQYVPRRFWNDAVRKEVFASAKRPLPVLTRPGSHFQLQLAAALAARAEQLEAGLPDATGLARNDRLYEIASLRARVRQLVNATATETAVRFRARSQCDAPVSQLIFGNNINTQNLTAPYDSSQGKFQEEFLARVRPMGITFLRYPGGCNADVFDWRDTIGPLDQRRDIINYHNGSSRGIATFGVDEYLRFCEEEGMVPIITTAFCKDRPEDIDPNDHPNGIRHNYVFSYLKRAPERVQLAADWVEYCNGSPDTRFGKLRAENGHPKPYGVKFWEIGNESYGPDPAGSCTAEEYAAAFPAYVKAMKARDPSIQIVINGTASSSWTEPLLRIAGKHADAFQFHIYLTPRVSDYGKLEGRPHEVTHGMRLADGIPGRLANVESLMKKHVGRTLPVIVSEFGMGNARNREFMTSVTSTVLVADMWRQLIESPIVHGANKWCLFTGYWFSQVQGPTLQQPSAPYYSRPEQIMHVIYNRCRGKTRLDVNNEISDGVKAVVFKRPDSYGVVLISREAVSWQTATLDLPDAKRGQATCMLVTAGHPFLGNENDSNLIRKHEFTFDYEPGTTIHVPANSVMGLILPR